MLNDLGSWIRLRYHGVVGSIAFYPAFIALLFAGLAFGMIWFDKTSFGVDLKAANEWLGLKDASAARTIIATITAGVLTLTVFSFSMVMIVLNQAASQLSNRTLDQLIGNRFQQVVLGAYIGTIIYGLLLLTTVRENDSGTSIPALSTYLLILVTIVDIFLFIYFLHFITRAVKYEVIIGRVHKETLEAMREVCTKDDPGTVTQETLPFEVRADRSGMYESFHAPSLVKFCARHDAVLEFTELPGSFILKGGVLLRLDRSLDEHALDDLRGHIPLARNGSMEGHYAFGFRQLTEMAMKALSPGVNDPGTALLALRCLFELFVFRLGNHPELIARDKEGKVRIRKREWPFELLFTSTIRAIWDYGKHDRSVRHELKILLDQLRTDVPAVQRMRQDVLAAIAEEG
ncbi:MAG: DUF2254 domain-containing protein [Flavobacteriales bacterium]|nr:DUF2254 domain-containing protein [Flavobacteriales bacterium]